MKKCAALLMVMLLELAFSCGEVPPNETNFVKARVLYFSCAGTIVQIIDEKTTVGKDWLWYKNLDGPFDATNAPETYSNSVSAFNISKDKYKVGDTISFTYEQLNNPPGNICTIGGMPTIYISVKQIK